MSKLHIIIGDQGVGKTTFARNLSDKKEFIHIDFKMFRSMSFSPKRADSAEVFILDDGIFDEYKDASFLFDLWNDRFYQVRYKGKAVFFRKTPDIIGIFHKGGISQYWIDTFLSLGADIHIIEKGADNEVCVKTLQGASEIGFFPEELKIKLPCNWKQNLEKLKTEIKGKEASNV